MSPSAVKHFAVFTLLETAVLEPNSRQFSPLKTDKSRLFCFPEVWNFSQNLKLATNSSRRRSFLVTLIREPEILDPVGCFLIREKQSNNHP